MDRAGDFGESFDQVRNRCPATLTLEDWAGSFDDRQFRCARMDVEANVVDGIHVESPQVRKPGTALRQCGNLTRHSREGKRPIVWNRFCRRYLYAGRKTGADARTSRTTNSMDQAAEG